MTIDIRVDDLSGPDVQGLLAEHLAGMRNNSPPDSVNSLDMSGLKSPDISVWTAWDGNELMGVCGLREMSPSIGELKSMRTATNHVRKGVAAAILVHIIGVAKSRGYERLSLETGSGNEFEPALRLYRKHGFVNGTQFGAYKVTPFNQFLHLEL